APAFWTAATAAAEPRPCQKDARFWGAPAPAHRQKRAHRTGCRAERQAGSHRLLAVEKAVNCASCGALDDDDATVSSVFLMYHCDDTPECQFSSKLYALQGRP